MAIPYKNTLGNPNVTEGNFQVAIEQLRESVIGSGKAYDSANTYMQYDTCVYGGVTYYSKINSNTGNTPAIGTIWGGIADLISSVQMLAGNGYKKLPGELIIQWGTNTGGDNDRDIYYPTTFPNAVFGVYATMAHGSIPTSEVQGVGTGNCTSLSFFSVYPRYQTTDGLSGVAAQYLKWFAVGY